MFTRIDYLLAIRVIFKEVCLSKWAKCNCVRVVCACVCVCMCVCVCVCVNMCLCAIGVRESTNTISPLQHVMFPPLFPLSIHAFNGSHSAIATKQPHPQSFCCSTRCKHIMNNCVWSCMDLTSSCQTYYDDDDALHKTKTQSTHAVTPQLHCSYTTVTLQLHRSYTTVTLQLHRSYTTVTLQLHRSYTAVTPQLHCVAVFCDNF